MKLSFPHPLIILLGFITLSALATLVIPSGSFDRVLDEDTGREIVIPGSFKTIEDVNPSFWEVLKVIPEGFVAGADIIVLILILGGAFYIVEKTGALQAGIEALIYRFRSSKFLLFYILGIVFAMGGASISMQEELIPMVPVFVILATKLNYDLRSIIAITLGSSLVGSAFSPINPFVGLLAQNIAEVPLFSGVVFRSTAFVFALLLWITYHVRAGKSKLPDQEVSELKPSPLSLRNASILFISFGGIGVMIYGITAFDWGYIEMSALFFLIGIVCGLVGGMGLNGTARTYVAGFGEMIFAGMIVGLARSVYLILEKGEIIDPLIQALFSPLESLPEALAVAGMFVSQALVHIPVPSTSGQAVLTIPLTAPLSDLIGLSRDVAVLAFQYPAGLMDLLTPTNGGMMAIIASAGISYKDWISYIWKSWLFIALIALAGCFLGILLFK
ncbi:YfcC family protein [Algoriphagus litoralis]|uniref:YfcC family protein n=1 Tax=Algoriphagus litoralis TaxID=2202829 RepID=UPI000DBAC8F3|nr:YfcC family protein [Algoriphagus litoralis]